MLRGLHKASSTWLGKAVMAAVMGVIAISFAIWGIGDIFRGFGRNAVATIGGTEISIEQFRQFYNERLQQLGRQAGRPITPDEARARGLDRQLLAQLIAETTVDEQAKQLRLGIDNAEIAKRITADPSFRGANGQFDRQRFEQIIRQAGFSESRFIEEQRRSMLRRQLAQSITGDLKVPATALAVLNQYQNEKRQIEYVALGAAQAGDVPAPTPEVLNKYFDERKTLFRAPEYRNITLLSLASSDLAKPDAVTDADAKAYFEQHKNSYGKPEKREVRQIVFQKPEEAADARERITKGAKFDDIAKERQLKQSDTDLGMVEKSDIIDSAVADAAFSLKPGETSAPVKGRFGTVLLQVGKIEPGEEKTYEQVAAQIKREIAESRAKSEVGNLRDKIEDERAAGSTLAEVAKKLGLKSVSIEAVDRSGRAPDGKPVAALPQSANVINAAFASDVGVDNDPLQLPGGGYLYYDVTGVTPSRERPLEEVKDQVTARWRDDEIAKRLQAKADDLVGKLKAGTSFAQAASEAGLNVQTAKDLQRGKSGGFIPAKTIEAVFRTPKGTPASAEGGKETERFVFRVTDVVDPPFEAGTPQGQAITTTLQNSYTDDLVGEYIARLENDFGVTVNPAALNQVVGGGSQQ
ncbi:MAG TPA: SurA N-terminal domain-containing protein [Pseudolabrys sp.]|jgi:peptidyl-prolyl cis-trans isomerase D|nr:SurA N-terminal domain-containing protein [Pseudolabrys sp.]